MSLRLTLNRLGTQSASKLVTTPLLPRSGRGVSATSPASDPRARSRRMVVPKGVRCGRNGGRIRTSPTILLQKWHLRNTITIVNHFVHPATISEPDFRRLIQHENALDGLSLAPQSSYPSTVTQVAHLGSPSLFLNYPRFPVPLLYRC